MSSTNRSNARDSHIADYYKTPVPSIMDFFMEFFSDYPEESFEAKMVLDPCAGGYSGTEIKIGENTQPLLSPIYTKTGMSYPEAIKKYNYEVPPAIYTIDIREDSEADIINDYLKMDLENRYDVIITNPPFNIALDIIKKALSDVKDGGVVIMLLRLNFFGSKARADFWDKNMPMCCYVHSKRMAFTSQGTDSVEYMHCVWKKGYQTKFTKLRVI